MNVILINSSQIDETNLRNVSDFYIDKILHEY